MCLGAFPDVVVPASPIQMQMTVGPVSAPLPMHVNAHSPYAYGSVPAYAANTITPSSYWPNGWGSNYNP